LYDTEGLRSMTVGPETSSVFGVLGVRGSGSVHNVAPCLRSDVGQSVGTEAHDFAIFEVKGVHPGYFVTFEAVVVVDEVCCGGVGGARN
jgi:hypothetical protein